MSMNFRLILLTPLLFFQVHLLTANAEWSILVYMQADNNLSEFADKDMFEIIKGYQNAASSEALNVNTLVQVDYPQDKKTWRFKIDGAGKIEHGSLSQEMGEHPAEELIASAVWVKLNYPAKHYAIILWNHGSGVEDYRKINTENARNFNSIWMDIFDKNILSTDKIKNLKKENSLKNNASDIGLGDLFQSGRGILYDDSEKTCLTNQGLSLALSRIKDVLGKKIDLVGMDACLMSMVEIAYEIKDYADILVASQETEPGYGWDYSGIMAPLVSAPSAFTAENLAKLIVASYANFYATTDMQNYTQSAINLSLLDPLCANIELVSLNILDSMRCKSAVVKKALRTARLNSKSFETASYVDLYSLYSALRAEFTKLRHDAENEQPTCFGFLNKTSPNYIPALDQLVLHLNEGIGLIESVVFANVVGAGSSGSHGISIYYPFSASSIHSSYPNTTFARNTHWINMLRSV
ncbi:MAG: clostripain-related cysteine peptidase [bacterium]